MHPSHAWSSSGYGSRNNSSGSIGLNPSSALNGSGSSASRRRDSLEDSIAYSTPPQYNSPPQYSTPPQSHNRSSFGSSTDIWTPMYAPQGLRGNSFGAYGSPSFDSERYRTGNAAWGSADLPRRRLASFPSAEPGSEPFLASLSPPQQRRQRLDFTGPSISILERFGNLGDATRQAEMARPSLWSGSSSPVPGAQVPVPHPVPLQHTPVHSQSSTPIHSQVSTPIHASAPLLVPVPVPISVAGGPSTGSGSCSISVLAQAQAQAHAQAQAQSQIPARSQAQKKPPNKPAKPTKQAVPTGPSAGRRKKRNDTPFLEKLRSSPSGNLTLSDILGNVLEASTDQHGSRFIQDKLPDAAPRVKHDLLQEMLPDALALATDVFGNYVVQLLFEVSSAEDREALRKQLVDQVLTLTLHMYGCRVIQMALMYLDNEGRCLVVEELKGQVLRCIKDHNGNHVVQKAVEHIPPGMIQFIYTDMLEQALALSKHMYGCRVIQRALEFGSASTKARLLQTIKDNIDMLVLDQYGNYVVQHVVEHGPKRDREHVLAQLSGRIVVLSSHKYASNVIERCFVKSSPAQRSLMVDTIVNSSKDGEPAVLAMMKDQFANYVIQRILGTAKDDDYNRLSLAVKKNLPAIRRSHQGKHLLAIERRLR